jgi:hypothetical protein
MTRKRLVHWWHMASLIASTTVGFLAIELPQYRDDLGVYGAFILVGVKLIDLWVNQLPKVLPRDDTDEAGA